jgi:hypothetical protein
MFGPADSPAALPIADAVQRLGPPERLPSALAPASITGSAAAATVPEVRLVIDVNPSPLFDVQTRKVTIDVMKENALRGNMGAAGVGR